MAFQIGDHKLKGTFYGVTYYKSVFGWLARLKAGPTSKQFKTAPGFARSRENSTDPRRGDVLDRRRCAVGR